MKVKDLIMKLDNTGIDIDFFGPDKGLIIVINIDTLKEVYNSEKGGIFREMFDRNIDKWEINRCGEIVSILLK